MVRAEIVLAVAAANFFAGFIGVVLILWGKKWSQRNLHWGIGFGAGILIGIALLEIVPTAIDLASEKAMVFVLIGFAGFFLIEKFTLVHHFDRKEGDSHLHFSIATFFVLCLHAVLDGVIIGLGLEFDEAFGLMIFVAILFHKLPLAVSVASVFLDKSEKKMAVLQMLIFALSTPVGLVATVVFLKGLPVDAIGAVAGLSAGIFLYLGATDMLPEISHPRHWEQGDESYLFSRWVAWEPTVWVFIGMVLSFVPHLLLEGSLHH